MDQPTARKRPWLAALLGVLATGVGHIYLRRWRRGLAWLVALLGVTILFVDPASVEALATLNSVNPLATAPIIIVGSLSVIDAYLVAHAQNTAQELTVAQNGRLTHCPNCNKELDTDLEFCHWCTTDLSDWKSTPFDSSERLEQVDD